MFIRMTEINSWHVFFASPCRTCPNCSATVTGVKGRITLSLLVRSTLIAYEGPRLKDVIGCYISLGLLEKAKELFDVIPGLIDKRKIGGKDLPTEVFIKKKSESFS